MAPCRNVPVTFTLELTANASSTLRRVAVVLCVARCVAVALLLASAASAKDGDQIITLASPSKRGEVTLRLAHGVQSAQPRNTGFLVLHVEYPSGRSVAKNPLTIPSPSVLRVTLEPLGGHRTRTEWMVSQALPQRPPDPKGREWLAREEGGIRVYAYRTRQGNEPETHVFTGTDGYLVGVQLAYPPFVMNTASRRYFRDLEVTYLSPPRVDPRSMDDFVLTFLRKNVSIVGKSR
jgi:hypothetical protein